MGVKEERRGLRESGWGWRCMNMVTASTRQKHAQFLFYTQATWDVTRYMMEGGFKKKQRMTRKAFLIVVVLLHIMTGGWGHSYGL